MVLLGAVFGIYGLPSIFKNVPCKHRASLHGNGQNEISYYLLLPRY